MPDSSVPDHSIRYNRSQKTIEEMIPAVDSDGNPTGDRAWTDTEIVGTKDAGELTEGTLDNERLDVVPIEKGGTGEATAETARTALGADDASNLSTGTLNFERLDTIPLNKGGTGATSKTAARAGLGIDDASQLSEGTLPAERLPNIPIDNLPAIPWSKIPEQPASKLPAGILRNLAPVQNLSLIHI